MVYAYIRHDCKICTHDSIGARHYDRVHGFRFSDYFKQSVVNGSRTYRCTGCGLVLPNHSEAAAHAWVDHMNGTLWVKQEDPGGEPVVVRNETINDLSDRIYELKTERDDFKLLLQVAEDESQQLRDEIASLKLGHSGVELTETSKKVLSEMYRDF